MTANSYIIGSALFVLISAVSVAYAQQKPQLPSDYPSRPIRIVTAPPGGGQDFASRIIAQGLSVALSQNVIVDNRAVNLIGEIVAKAPPDGYTLTSMGTPLWIESLIRKTPYDPVRDFEPITMLVNSPDILAVNSSLPVKSVKELIALAKAKPGELNYAEGGIGSPGHLGAELFKSMAGVNIVHIPFNGNAQTIISVIGGETQLTFASSASLAPHIKSGKLRALAITGAKPSALFPGLPTVAETLPGYEYMTSSAMFAPAGTSAAIINRLNREVVRVLNQAEVRAKFFTAGSEIVGSSPEQLAAAVKTDMTRLGKVIKDVGIRSE